MTSKTLDYILYGKSWEITIGLREPLGLWMLGSPHMTRTYEWQGAKCTLSFSLKTRLCFLKVPTPFRSKFLVESLTNMLYLPALQSFGDSFLLCVRIKNYNSINIICGQNINNCTVTPKDRHSLYLLFTEIRLRSQNSMK